MILATNVWSAVEAAVIIGGISLLAAVVGTVFYCCVQADKGKGMIPWKYRRRVEAARASKDIAELRIQEEAAEIKYMALQPVRQRVTEAIQNGETVNVTELLAGAPHSPSAAGQALRLHAFGDAEVIEQVDSYGQNFKG